MAGTAMSAVTTALMTRADCPRLVGREPWNAATTAPITATAASAAAAKSANWMFSATSRPSMNPMPDVFASTQPHEDRGVGDGAAEDEPTVRVEQREDTPADLHRGDRGERDDGLAVLAVHADGRGVDHPGPDRRERGDGECRCDRECAPAARNERPRQRR